MDHTETEIGIQKLLDGKLDVLIIIGDCLKALPMLPENSINLTVCDPPYESLDRHRAVGTTTRLKESKSSSNPWFESFPNTGYFKLYEELYRVHAKDTHCYTFCDSETEHVILSGHNPYDAKLDMALERHQANHNTGAPRGQWTAWPTLTWLKSKNVEADPETLEYPDLQTGMGYHWRRTSERILFLEKGKRKLTNLGWTDTLLGPRAERKDFPSQKPEQVLARLIGNSSAPGDVVLDCFAGSGGTASAALTLNRRCVLIEKTPSDWLRQCAADWQARGWTVEWRKL